MVGGLHSFGGGAEPEFGQGDAIVATVETLVFEQCLFPQRRGDLVGHGMGDAERLRRPADRGRPLGQHASAEQVFGQPGRDSEVAEFGRRLQFRQCFWS